MLVGQRQDDCRYTIIVFIAKKQLVFLVNMCCSSFENTILNEVTEQEQERNGFPFFDDYKTITNQEFSDFLFNHTNVSSKISWRNIVTQWLLDKIITQEGNLDTLDLMRLLIQI